MSSLNAAEQEDQEEEVVRAVSHLTEWWSWTGAGTIFRGDRQPSLSKRREVKPEFFLSFARNNLHKLKFERQSLFTRYLCLQFSSERLVKYFQRSKIWLFAYSLYLTKWNVPVYMLGFWLKWQSLWAAIWKLFAQPMCNLFHEWPCFCMSVTGLASVESSHGPATPWDRSSWRTQTSGSFHKWVSTIDDRLQGLPQLLKMTPSILSLQNTFRK